MPSAVSSLRVTKFRPGLQTMTFPPVIFTLSPMWGGFRRAFLSSRRTRRALTLYSSGAVTRSQAMHLLDANAIEVAGNSVLQRACRDGETDGVERLAPGKQRVDHPRREGVARTNAIDDADVITRTLQHLIQ